jgi:hypothetical protein
MQASLCENKLIFGKFADFMLVKRQKESSPINPCSRNKDNKPMEMNYEGLRLLLHKLYVYPCLFSHENGTYFESVSCAFLIGSRCI